VVFALTPEKPEKRKEKAQFWVDDGTAHVNELWKQPKLRQCLMWNTIFYKSYTKILYCRNLALFFNRSQIKGPHKHVCQSLEEIEEIDNFEWKNCHSNGWKICIKFDWKHWKMKNLICTFLLF